MVDYLAATFWVLQVVTPYELLKPCNEPVDPVLAHRPLRVLLKQGHMLFRRLAQFGLGASQQYAPLQWPPLECCLRRSPWQNHICTAAGISFVQTLAGLADVKLQRVRYRDLAP